MSIEIQQLSKSYGGQLVLDNVSFQANPGQVLGFLGPNGAGKSTTMKIITGFLQADSGEALVNGISVKKHSRIISKLIGYLPEHNPLYEEMYIPEFLSFIGGLYQMKRNVRNERVKIVMEQCGLSQERHKRIGNLSKGYKQRVGLAKSLVHDPEIIILDEPTTGLDPNQLVEIRHLIKEISKNKTLILSTHIMQEVEILCDKVVIINKGKLVAQDSLQNLKASTGKSIVLLETEETIKDNWLTGLSFSALDRKRPGLLALTCKDPKKLRIELFEMIQKHNLNLVSISQEEINLESVFYSLTKS
ncbi:gliding motility-associated ABC transporter ATP-binding subunit GldA [Cyclobacterium amurskyense]|uniref:Gliding motility-associated ABC transporter ATP-binding subunit GldA n=1 Tax=Cyclobacterium amurskyense TaxID=320787 RepID=A0A0H4P6H5_9BACT|nr:gliding motility-associated ABC transporter ATP-binding subunit GldA [Cyclobacterium amurskyense]AKP50031.1 Gliding motility-associated ABC transporter ATP-binding subunit GldA [Cyclobacterium amurskyense]